MRDRIGEPAPFVDVMTRETAAGTRAHFHGVLRCGCWHSCIRCSWALKSERGADVVQAARWWRDEGGTLELLTLTFAHSSTDDPRDLIKKRSRCWRALWAGMPGKRLRRTLGIHHYIRGNDETWGDHGLHPHFHVLLFTRAKNRGASIAALKNRWYEMVRKVLGRDHLPSWENGAVVKGSRKDDYLAKLGLELTSPHTKSARRGGMNPWQLARAAVDGDESAAAKWQVYTRGMKGQPQLSWSRGVKKAAGIVDRTDQQIVDAEGRDAEERHVASIPGRHWDEIAHVRGAHYALKRAAETRGLMGVAETFALYAFGLAPPEPGENPDQLVLDLFNDFAPVERERRAAA